jgi:tetratricopeptide (TPR) repeat protein
MADDLRRYVNRFAILARRTGPLGRFRKWVRRNPALSAALAAVLLCAAVAGVLAYQTHLAKLAQAEEQAKREVEVLDEKRRSALDKAVLLSRVEDFDGARQAIREAEKLGCSAGQIRMLQGQLELCQGRTKEAIEQLTQATDLLPESVAAWSMLSVALGMHGQHAECNRALAEATRLPAVTPEDYLFRGLAEGGLDPERGLATLEEAVRRRPSALAHLLHCESLRMHVLAHPDVERARRVMDDIRFLKRQLPENAMALSMSIQTHVTCWLVFDELNRPELRQTAFDEGINDARALERFPDSTQAVISRWVFLDLTGQGDAGIAALHQLAERTKVNMAVYFSSQYHYRRGEYDRAIKLLEQLPGEANLDLFRVLTLAELPGGRDAAVKLHQEITARNLTDWDLFNSQLILRFLGRKAEAVNISRKLLDDPGKFPPVRKEQFRWALEYCAGQRSADDLVASMRGHRGELSNAHLCIAVTALADGDRAAARKHLQLCVDTRFYEWLPYDLGRMLLSRIDREPAWPLWIKPAK